MIYAKNGRFLLGGKGFSYAMFVDGQGFCKNCISAVKFSRPTWIF